jgi:hypothetical protein
VGSWEEVLLFSMDFTVSQNFLELELQDANFCLKKLAFACIDDQQAQIIIITVVVKGATGQHLRYKCHLAFHSQSFRVSLPHLLLLLSLESH